eukprot:4958812-Prymnesium_polylepis.1
MVADELARRLLARDHGVKGCGTARVGASAEIQQRLDHAPAVPPCKLAKLSQHRLHRRARLRAH